jgi:hypothetical protein
MKINFRKPQIFVGGIFSVEGEITLAGGGWFDEGKCGEAVFVMNYSGGVNPD